MINDNYSENEQEQLEYMNFAKLILEFTDNLEDLYGTNIFTVSSDQPDIGAYLLMNNWDLYTRYSWYLVE